MKYYLPAIVFIVVVLGLSIAGFRATLDSFTQVREKIATLKQTIADNHAVHQARMIQISKQDERSVPMVNFLEQWSDELEGVTSGTVSTQIERIAQDETVALTGKSASVVASYPFRGSTMPVIRGSFKASGPYDRVMRWLNGVEKRFPASRFDTIVMGTEDEAVQVGVLLIQPPNLADGSRRFE